MVGAARRATNPDWPRLKRLIPDYFQYPPIEVPIEKQKQSENPAKNEPIYIRKARSFSKPK